MFTFFLIGIVSNFMLLIFYPTSRNIFQSIQYKRGVCLCVSLCFNMENEKVEKHKKINNIFHEKMPRDRTLTIKQ